MLETGILLYSFLNERLKAEKGKKKTDNHGCKWVLFHFLFSQCFIYTQILNLMLLIYVIFTNSNRVEFIPDHYLQNLQGGGLVRLEAKGRDQERSERVGQSPSTTFPAHPLPPLQWSHPLLHPQVPTESAGPTLVHG